MLYKTPLQGLSPFDDKLCQALENARLFRCRWSGMIPTLKCMSFLLFFPSFKKEEIVILLLEIFATKIERDTLHALFKYNNKFQV